MNKKGVELSQTGMEICG